MQQANIQNWVKAHSRKGKEIEVRPMTHAATDEGVFHLDNLLTQLQELSKKSPAHTPHSLSPKPSFSHSKDEPGLTGNAINFSAGEVNTGFHVTNFHESLSSLGGVDKANPSQGSRYSSVGSVDRVSSTLYS